MKTVKIKVAVAVDPEGGWMASGWSDRNGEPVEEAMENCIDDFGGNEAKYWLEAELPIPKEMTVQATVVESDD